MRKVILQEFVTLNGLAAGPDGNVDFVPASTHGDQIFGRDQLALLDTIDTILLGRVTYQLFAGFWPLVTEGDDKVFADKLNSTPKVVFSRTLDRAPWGSWNDAKIVKTAAADEVAALKRQPGNSMILWGSLSLAQSLIDEKLIDEYRLIVCPLVLGSGRPLFSDKRSSIDLDLVSAKMLERAAALTYVPKSA